MKSMQVIQDTKARFDAEAVRKDFPLFGTKMHGKPIAFLDSAASSQKPQQVIDAIANYYSTEHANVHRGIYELSAHATERFEEARRSVMYFINAAHEHEVIFTKGTTESINLVANGFAEHFLNKGDEILISAMEHHSNIVPWQIACEKTGALLKILPVTETGEWELDLLDGMLTSRTRLVAVSHISNSLGTINPVKSLIAQAHAKGIPVLIDGAQAAPHIPIDVRDFDAEFYAFSAHKMFGPTGIGVLYGKTGWLEKLPPYQSGGEMISRVTFEKTTYNDLPFRFEAGTPHISGAIGLAEAISYLNNMNRKAALEYEQALTEYATDQLQSIPDLQMIGIAEHKASLLSFIIEGIHPSDIGTILDHEGVAVRTGHHCTQPLMDQYGIPGTVRASMCFYNTVDDIDRLVAGTERAVKMLKG